jgi:hypothetical protein
MGSLVADGVADIFVVAAQPIDPPDHERIASPELVVEPAAFGALGEPSAQSGDAVVRDHLVNAEARRLGMGELVVDGLLGC